MFKNNEISLPYLAGREDGAAPDVRWSPTRGVVMSQPPEDVPRGDVARQDVAEEGGEEGGGGARHHGHAGSHFQALEPSGAGSVEGGGLVSRDLLLRLRSRWMTSEASCR